VAISLPIQFPVRSAIIFISSDFERKMDEKEKRLKWKKGMLNYSRP
jgi:hypothetical protein